MYTKSPSCRSDGSGSSRMTMSTESQVGPTTVQGMSGPERSVRMRYFKPSLLSITPPNRPASQCIQRLPARVAVPSTRQTKWPAAGTRERPGQARAELGGQGDDLARVGGAGSEFAGQRPVAADVGSGDPQVLLGIRLGLVDAPQLIGAVDDEPFHAPGGGVGDRLARLHGVGKEDFGRRHAETQEKLELGRRRDLKARALLHQHLEHPAVRIGLDRVMRAHAGHGGAEAPHLAAHDGGVDDQERSAVPLVCGLADDLEVEADLGMRVEELFLLRLPGKCVLSAACKATWAIPHQSSPEMDLGLRNIADANFIDRAAVPFACHDDLLLLAEVEGKTPADYRDDPSGVKGSAKIFHFFCVALRRSPAVVSTQGVVA